MPSSLTHFRSYQNILSISPRNFKPVLKAKSISIRKLKDKNTYFTDISSNLLIQAQGKKLTYPLSISFPQQRPVSKGKKLFKKGR